MIDKLVSTINNSRNRGRNVNLPYTLETINILRILEWEGYIKILEVDMRNIKIEKIVENLKLKQLSKKSRKIYSRSRSKLISLDDSIRTYIVRTNKGIKSGSLFESSAKGELLIEVSHG